MAVSSCGLAESISASPTDTEFSDDYTEIGLFFARMAEASSDEERQHWRCRIITGCLPLADHIAYRFVGRGEPGEDLIQVARLGLIRAVDRYDPSKGPFLAFVVPTIVGSVRRHFRDNTWGMHVPRQLKVTHRRVRATIDPLAQRLGRAPTASELAAELDVSREEVIESMEAAYAYRPLSLDAALPGSSNGESSTLWRHGAEDPLYGSIEDALTVSELVSHLSEREQTILRMRFCEGLPQTAIAAQLGISQVHVSRLLAMILERLRRRFCDDTTY